MAETSACYKHLEATNASLTTNQLTREIAFASDLDALTFKTESGVRKYFYSVAPTSLSGTGSTNYVPYWNGTNSLSSTNIYYTSAGRIGINDTAPDYPFDVHAFTMMSNGMGIVSTSAASTIGTKWIYYPNLVNYNCEDISATGVLGAYTINTNIDRLEDEMFKIRVHGYEYGCAMNLDFTVVGYSYVGSNGTSDNQPGAVIVYSMVDNGNDGYSKWVGINAAGKVAIATNISRTSFTESNYFGRISVDYWSTKLSKDASTGWTISATTVSAGATSGFGWKDFHYISSISRNNGRTGRFEVSTDIKVDGDIYTTAWQSYTPSISGWSATNTSAFQYKTVGDLVFVKYAMDGTGDSNQTIFSAPVLGTSGFCDNIAYIGYNTGSTHHSLPGSLKISNDGNYLVAQDTTTGLVEKGSVYGDTNKKWLCGQIWYEKA